MGELKRRAMKSANVLTEEEFVAQLQKMVPSIRVDGDYLIIPPLKVARKEFDEYTGVPNNWNDGEEWTMKKRK